MRFFATVNQMFGVSSPLPTTAEHCFVVWTDILGDLITARSAVIGRSGAADHVIDGTEKCICRLSFEF